MLSSELFDLFIIYKIENLPMYTLVCVYCHFIAKRNDELASKKDKVRALASAEAFISENPFFIHVMKSSNVGGVWPSVVNNTHKCVRNLWSTWDIYLQTHYYLVVKFFPSIPLLLYVVLTEGVLFN